MADIAAVPGVFDASWTVCMRGAGVSSPACWGGTGRAGCSAFAAPQEAGGPEALGADANFAVRAATVTDVRCLAAGAAGFWNSVVASPGMHRQIAVDAVQLAVNGVRSGYVAGLVASLRVVGYAMILAAGSLPEIDVTQLYHHTLRTRRDEVWQELHVSSRLAPSANARLCTYFRWFQPFARAATILRLPISHTAMWQLLLFRTGCHGLAVDLGRGSGIARAERSCAMCGACPGDEMHLVFECAALQVLRHDMPTLFQGVHSMRCFVWQDNMVLMSSFVRDAMRMVGAAGSGNKLDV